MPDVKKVIKGLECCTTAIGCYECPYAVGGKATNACNLLIDRDALALLKEQEPLKPVPSDRYVRTEPVTFDYKCVVCNAGLVRHWVCCPCCGQAVKWE